MVTGVYKVMFDYLCHLGATPLSALNALKAGRAHYHFDLVWLLKV
jgi:hypothetical protein